MYRRQQTGWSRFFGAVKKLSVSAFVICSFIAYALQQRLGVANSAASNLPPASSPPAAVSRQVTPGSPGFTPAPTQAAPAPTNPPTSTPAPAQASGQYKDGQYNGPAVDAFYGVVQVQADVQGGKLTAVQVPQYPNDRRTSVRINSQAVPWLQQEAVQAQSANIDLISGATLTSEAFQQSLQAALASAQQ